MFVCCLVIALAVGIQPDCIYPGYLGAACAPSSQESLPLLWSPATNVAWRTAVVGAGRSQPVIWDGNIYVTSVDPQSLQYAVSAIRLDDGSRLWTHQGPLTNLVLPQVAVDIAAASPVVDANYVYALFGTGQLMALTSQGQMIWQRDLFAQFGPIQSGTGLVGSLAQDESRIFVAVQQDGPCYLLALDKLTGDVAWKVDRLPGASVSSPVLLDLAGVPQIVVSARGTVDSYDATTGQWLWSAANFSGVLAPAPAAIDRTRILLGTTDRRAATDWRAAFQSNLALDVRFDGAAWDVSAAWFARGGLASDASPFAHRGFAYWLDHRARLTCFDAATGEEEYRERLPEPTSVTPLCVGDRIYCFGKRGTTTVVAAGPEFRILATNSLSASGADDPSPVIPIAVAAVNGSLLLRTEQALVCLRNAAADRAGIAVRK